MIYETFFAWTTNLAIACGPIGGEALVGHEAARKRGDDCREEAL
jgi:hypothetical protein